MNRARQRDVNKNTRSEYLEVLNEHHTRSGMSLREVAQSCNFDHSYLSLVLAGKRQPRRDVIIALGFAYSLELGDVDEILLLAGYPPLGRNSRREFSQSLQQKQPA